MNCEEYREIAAADVDGTLTAEEARLAAEHLAVCPRCQQSRREQQFTKDMLRQRVPRHTVPDDLRRQVVSSLGAELETGHVRRADGSRRLLVGAIAALLAIGLYSLLSPAKPDLVAVMRTEVDAADAGQLALGLRTGSVEDLEHFFQQSGRIDFDDTVGDFSPLGLRLVGGSVVDIGTQPTTLSVYDSGHGKVICRRFREGKIDVPEVGERIAGRWIFTVDGVTYGVARLEGGVVCILASKMPRQMFVQHLERALAQSSGVAVPAVGPLL